MGQLLEIREKIKYIFRKNEKTITIGTKFIINFTMYLWIFSFGMYDEIFARFFEGSTQFIYLGTLCFLGVILPLPYVYFLFAINIFMQLSLNIFFALLLFLIMVTVILVYVRIVEKEAILLLVTTVGLVLNIPFVAPVAAGIYFGITAFIPLVLGVVLYLFINCYSQFVVFIESNVELQEIGIDQAVQTYQFISNYFKSNANLLSYTIILVGGFFVIKIIQKLNINYYKYVGVAVGFVYFLVSFILCKIIFKLEYSFFSFLVGVILSAIVIFIIMLFDTILDYKYSKFLKFEDKENMYFVKIVPKKNVMKEMATDSKNN